MNFDGKTAIVTGGSRGIGFAIATEFVQAGANVVISSRSEKALNAAATKLQKGHNAVTPFPCDVTDSEAVQRMVEETIESFGQIDVLVNNAGVTRDNLLLRMSEQDWDTVIRTNLKGTFLCSKAVSRQMLRQRSGTIINISSVVGVTGNPGQTNYAASKAGILGLTKSTARELSSRGITVNAIAPGYIDTDMTENLDEKQREELTARIPLGRIGTPQDVSHLVLFLASDHGKYITGQVIRVDGGMVMS